MKKLCQKNSTDGSTEIKVQKALFQDLKTPFSQFSSKKYCRGLCSYYWFKIILSFFVSTNLSLHICNGSVAQWLECLTFSALIKREKGEREREWERETCFVLKGGDSKLAAHMLITRLSNESVGPPSPTHKGRHPLAFRGG